MEEKKETICALTSNLEVVVQFLTSLSMLMRCAVAIS